MTAWFMWQLQGDEEAAKAFVGENPEIMNNGLYQDQKINIEAEQNEKSIKNNWHYTIDSCLY